jgi:hypothetical protein
MHYKQLVFTNAAFTRDSSCVTGTIFRNVCIWQISNQALLCTLQVTCVRYTSKLGTRSYKKVYKLLKNYSRRSQGLVNQQYC